MGVFNVLVILGTVLVLSGMLVAYNFVIQRNSVLGYTRGALEFLVLGGSLGIRGEDVLQLNREEDWRSPAYARIYKVLSDLYLPNVDKNLRENSIYILKPNPAGDGMIFAAHLPGIMDAEHHLGRIEDMNDSTVNYIGDRYPMTPLMRDVLEGRRDYASTGVYEDEHGVWVSAYAPIRTADGKPVALLEADYPIGVIQSEVAMIFMQEVLGILLASLVTILIVIWLSRRITVPLGALVDAVDRIAQGAPEVRVDFQRADEIGKLGRHFNHMAKVVEEKTRLSRYVSSETVRKVESSGGEGESEGTALRERVKLCILFSDIRGFTAYSDNHSAEKVIDVLNEALQSQTECIVRHGGVVDKFVGDEIMAEFKGDDMVDNAFLAALEIQHEIRSLTEREGLTVGIGVNVGEVVRGDIGSYFRLDYTVIGSTVNLAARLCSVAKGGQILTSEATLSDARGDYQSKLLGKARVKGIAQPFRLFSVFSETTDPA